MYDGICYLRCCFSSSVCARRLYCQGFTPVYTCQRDNSLLCSANSYNSRHLAPDFHSKKKNPDFDWNAALYPVCYQMGLRSANPCLV